MLFLIITVMLQISLAAIIPGDGNLRDVRELFANDIGAGGAGVKLNSFEKEGIKDPIRGMQSFVTKVVNPSLGAKNIGQLEQIIEDGRALANKDEAYAKFLSDVKNNLEEQKSQLFKLKLTNSETNVASMLANVEEGGTSNDFIAIDSF